MDVFFKRSASVEKKVEEKFGSWKFSRIFAPLLEKDSSLKRLKSNKGR
jgi:hypothetical protein